MARTARTRQAPALLRAQRDGQRDARVRRDAAAAQAATDAYTSWARIDTLDVALAEVDAMAAKVAPMIAENDGDASPGAVYRMLADTHVDSHARLSTSAAWWDAKCDAASRLLWQAANGRAKAHGA